MSNYPEAYLCLNKNRIKQYNKQSQHAKDSNTVYLNDGDEFEIELNNTTNKTVLAKITIEGKSIGAGLVFHPGQRVYLERYLNEAKKFKFSTYEVPTENEKYTKQNGGISISFYNEQPKPQYPISILRAPSWDSFGSGGYGLGGSNYYSGAITRSVDVTNMSARNVTWDSFNSPVIGTSSYTAAGYSQPVDAPNDTVETGKVERGSYSNQTFVYVDKTFYSVAFYTQEIKVLPHSRKQIGVHELKTYCTQCGTRLRKQWQFCATCGTRK